MNHISKLTRSRWLLLTLFTLLVGVSPAWATKTILSEGFENGLNGWTLSSAASSTNVESTGKRTGNNGFTFYYNTNPPQYLISPEINIPSNAADIILSFYYKARSGSYPESFKVGYSTTNNETTSFTWDEEVTNITTTSSFTEYTNTSFSIPVTAKYIAIAYTANNMYSLYIDDINLTCEVTGPDMGVLDGSTQISTGYNYSFGLATAGIEKTFTLKNEGTVDVALNDPATTGGYSAELSSNTLAAGGQVTLTVGMSSTTGDGTVTISSSTDGINDFVINVSGTAKDPSKLWCDFASGLPSGWDNTGGWAISNSGADGITSGGGYASNTSYGTNKRMFTPLVTITEGEKLYLMVKGNSSTASYNKLYIQYSANGTDWTTAKSLESITNTWQSVEVTEIPAGNWYIGFYGSYAYFTDIYGGTESTAPVLSLSQSSYDFGLINENTTSTAITITNTGKSELTGMNLVSSNAAFTFNVTDNATTIAANGGTATFTVTMSSANAGTKNGTITIKSGNADDLVLNVSGAVMKAGTTTETFNNNQKPERWTNSSDTYYYWNFSDGKASAGSGSQYSNYAYMITPKMTVSADDFLAIKIKAQNSTYGFLKVYTSTDGTFGSTPVKEISYSELSTSDYKTIIVNGLTSEVKYFKFEGYYVTLDEIAGLTYAPVLVVKDAEDAVQASPVAYAFGEQGANASVTYRFTNGGAGTLNITNVVVTNDPADGTFTTNWTESVATPFNLVITQNYDAEKAGAKTGSVVVTMSDASTFTINLSGTLLAANAPTLAVDNTLEFGKLTANDTQTVTVTNSGTGSMTVDIVSDNALFTVSPAQLTEIGAGASKTFDVTFHYDQVTAGNYGIKNANITVTPTYNAEAAIVINASAKAKDPEEWGEDFAGNALPDGWEVTGYTDKWTFENGIASSSYSSNKGYLETPLLTVAENDVLSFQAKSTFNGSVTIKVYKKAGAGDWENTAFKTISLASSDYGIWKDYTIEGLSAGTYKFRFENEDYALDNFEGFKRVQAPEFSVYSDDTYANEKKVTMAESTDFGFVDEEKTTAYYIKNTGLSAMSLAAPVAQSPLTASFSDASVGVTETGEGDAKRWNIPVDGTIKLNITMSNTAAGQYTDKTVTVTADDEVGTFVASYSGIVTDANHYNIDFATAAIPNDWTDDGEYSNWTKNNEGYISTTGSSNLTTSALVATTGEKLYIQRDGNALTIKYKELADENFSNLQALAYTSKKKIDEITMPDGLAADKILLQFSGSSAKIYRIYGLAEPHEPKMAVAPADDSYDFGMQNAATSQEFIVTNSGNADLEGVTAELTGDDAADYQVALSIPDGSSATINENVATVPAGQTLKVTATLKASTEFKKHNATLTIASTSEGIAEKVIMLTGKTRDVAKQYVEFATEIPNGWTSNGWSVTNGEAKATNGTLRTTPLTIAANETMAVDARISNSNSGSLKVRYTTNNGVDWQETTIPAVYNYTTSSTYTFNLGNTENAVTAFFEFVGENAVIDNFYGGVAATAPLLEVTENTSAVANNDDFDFGSNLQAEPAAKVLTLVNKGNASMNVTIAKTGDVTVTPAAATIAAGETADVTVSLPYDQANVGDKTGAVTITLGTAVFTLNFTGNTIDPTALNEELASLPAGWYNGGWTVSGSANIYSGVEKELITEQYGAEEGKNVLNFKAKAQSGSEATLKVYTSTDRKTWSEPTEFGLTNEYATKSLDALADGNYYVKFVSLNANIDDLTGLKKITTAPEHDLYVSTSNIPTETKVPETSITATATVYSLRAAETGVYAKMFFDNVEVATADAQNISLNGSKTFELTGNVPATEKTYAAKIVVYYSNNSVAFETLTTDVEVQHTRTLAITAFERVGEGDLSANVDNKITAQFNVTVQNNSTCDLTADEVKVSIVNAAGEVYQMNDADNVTAATAVLAKDESVVIPVTLTISAGEGGDFKFRAKELVSNTTTLEANDITIHVNAQAPQFALNIKGGAALADGDDVAFGLVKEATTKQYTISNTGTKALVLTSIVAPAGYSVTEINNANKTIAVNGTLDIDVTLLAEQGKKAGDLVFTYDVNGTPTTFTLALTGRSEAANVWEEYFTTEIPASWQKTGWTWNDDRQTAYSGGVQGEFTLMTPRLSAAAGQVLTYETKWQYDGENMTVQYSTDKTSWTDYETITASTETVEHQFVAPAAGNYYLKFTANRYVNLDNFIGFALNIPEHDMELTASDVPATGKRLNNYVATVTLKENVGKNEDITAELWVNGAKVNATADVTSVEANSNATVVTLTWEPQTTMDAVDAYVKVTYAGGTLQTTPVSLTIAEVYTLSENSSVAVEAVTNETVMLERTFAAGWNTVCLPFAVADNTAIEALFGAGTKVFNFKNYANSMIDFEAVTSMAAATPYLIYVPAAITEPIRVNNVTITSLNTTAGTVWHNSITFHGSYAPVAAGDLAGKYGVTTTNQLAKGNSNTTMKGFRAYFEGNLANARILIFDEATGISRVYQAADLFGEDNRVYNMKGQQVENAKKGVYIVNGKKVVIK